MWTEESPHLTIPPYLLPIWEAAEKPIKDRPETQSAQLELERAEWALRAEDAEWRPNVYSDANTELSEQESNNSTEAGSSSTVVRNTANTGEVGLNQSFSTGTDIRVNASSSRETNNRRNSFLQESWVSRVRLTVTQNLLRGNNREANLRAVRDAEAAIEDSREAVEQEVLDSFSDLSESWLDYGRAQFAYRYALQALESNRQGLELAKARFDSGLSSRSELLARERDLAEQQATVGRLERDVESQVDDLRLLWGIEEIPSLEQLAVVAQESLDLDHQEEKLSELTGPIAQFDTVLFQETYAGRDAQRSLENAQRASHAADDAGQDSLNLEAGVGLSGRDRGFSSSWDELSGGDSFDVNVGLRYEHVIGGSRQRAERERSLKALHQAQWDYKIQERDWTIDVNDRRRNRQDALEEIRDSLQTREATREERDLIQAEFEAGKTDIRDLIDAEERVRNADQDLIDDYFSLLISDLRLRQQLDQLPLFFHQTSQTPTR